MIGIYALFGLSFLMAIIAIIVLIKDWRQRRPLPERYNT
tara:strand:+ start:1394 stop:1510 length:117 start_codon:yes stop_codon:yes gene_type:complete